MIDKIKRKYNYLNLICFEIFVNVKQIYKTFNHTTTTRTVYKWKYRTEHNNKEWRIEMVEDKIEIVSNLVVNVKCYSWCSSCCCWLVVVVVCCVPTIGSAKREADAKWWNFLFAKLCAKIFVFLCVTINVFFPITENISSPQKFGRAKFIFDFVLFCNVCFCCALLAMLYVIVNA